MKKELFADMSDQWSYELFLCIFMIHWILVWVFMTFRDRPPSWIIYHSKAYLKIVQNAKEKSKKNSSQIWVISGPVNYFYVFSWYTEY